MILRFTLHLHKANAILSVAEWVNAAVLSDVTISLKKKKVGNIAYLFTSMQSYLLLFRMD